MSFSFVDSHVHFWDRGTLPYPWLDALPAIAGRHTPAELAREAADCFPEKMVFVECGAPGREELRWVEQLAVAEPRIAGIVAHCRVDEGAATETRLGELASRPLVRGVRQLIQHEPDPDFCARAEFIAGVRAVGAAGLSFDICCFHPQLAAVVRLVRACPNTRFILDHLGKPGIRTGQLEPWRTHLRELALLPNIEAKLSGLMTEADLARWEPAQLRPYVEHALATFGPARLLFGGDWPVAKLAGSYPRWLATARALVSSLSPAEQDAIFRENARRVYRLGG
jgi:L-fuconolactonase